jgi:hypothetical protein
MKILCLLSITILLTNKNKHKKNTPMNLVMHGENWREKTAAQPHRDGGDTDEWMEVGPKNKTSLTRQVRKTLPYCQSCPLLLVGF